MAAKILVRPYRILLVEDDTADAMLFEEALLDDSQNRDLVRVSDGVAALEHLREDGRPRPDLIVLDLNMPRMNGAETLKVLKEDQEFKAIPVVILTTSAASEDICGAYATHANAYVVKPVNLDEFISAVHNIDVFYRQLAEPLPDN